MAIFFTADQHHGHDNIIRFCSRPFADIGEMDEALARNWNAVVGRDDVVYLVGDFTLKGRSGARWYFSKLNGWIRVLGNPWHHDRRWLPGDRTGSCPEYVSASGYPIDLLPPMVVLEYPELGRELGNDDHPQVIVLCHYPLAQWDRQHYGAWHLFGHCHGTYRPLGLCFDVGVDANNYTPVSLSKVVERFEAMSVSMHSHMPPAPPPLSVVGVE